MLERMGWQRAEDGCSYTNARSCIYLIAEPNRKRHDMKRLRVFAVTALAVLGALAVTAGQAFAVERSGEFVGKEGKSLAGTKFEGHAITQSVLEIVNGVKISCKGTTESGEIKGTGAKSGVFEEREERYKECKNSLGLKCKSAEGKEEEIIIKGVKVSIVAEKEGAGKKLEGLLIKSELAGESEFKCSTVAEKLRGSNLVPVKAEQEGTLKSAFKFAATGVKGVQSPIEALNPATGKKEKSTLELNFNGEGFEQSSIEGSWEATIGTSGEFR